MSIAIQVGGDPEAATVTRFVTIDPNCTISQIGDGGGVIAATIPVEKRSNGDVLFTIGTPICRADTQKIVDVPSAIVHYQSQDGAFCSFFWSEKEKQLVVVTDFLGFKPLYVEKLPGQISLASETKGWIRDPDPAAWGHLISLGYTLGDRTLLQGIDRVGPAAVLVYDLLHDRLEQKTYWNWPAPQKKADLEAVISSLRKSIIEYSRYNIEGQLLLSGGFDSRVIACILKESDIPVKAVSVTHDEEIFDADSQFAGSIASNLKIPFTRIPSRRGYFSSREFLEYLTDSDASIPSLYLFISQISQFISAPAIWQGLVPGFTLTIVHQPPGGFTEFFKQEVQDPNLGSAGWTDAQSIFRQDFCDAMAEGFLRDWSDHTSRYPDDGYGVSEFMIRNRARNRTGINPLQIYSKKSTVFLPGMTRAFFNSIGGVSYECRADFKLYMELFKKYFPIGLTVPLISGGTLVRPGRWSAPYYFNRVAADLERTLRAYPRAARFLGLKPGARTPEPSTFVDLDLLLQDDDPCVASDRVRDLKRQNRLSPGASKLLFHWRAWHWVHQGKLMEKLASRAV